MNANLSPDKKQPGKNFQADHEGKRGERKMKKNTTKNKKLFYQSHTFCCNKIISHEFVKVYPT